MKVPQHTKLLLSLVPRIICNRLRIPGVYFLGLCPSFGYVLTPLLVNKPNPTRLMMSSYGNWIKMQQGKTKNIKTFHTNSYLNVITLLFRQF